MWAASHTRSRMRRCTSNRSIPRCNGVEAPILLGSDLTSSGPCLALLLSICFLLLITVWVTPENRLAELALRGSSVLTQDFRSPQMGFSLRQSRTAQFACISRLVLYIYKEVEMVNEYLRGQGD